MNNTKNRWSASNPSPASKLMLSLGCPTNYSSEYARSKKTAAKKARRLRDHASRVANAARRIPAKLR